MARYRVRTRSYIGRLVEPGDIVEWDGIAGSNLERLGAPRRGRRSPTQPPSDTAKTPNPDGAGDQGND